MYFNNSPLHIRQLLRELKNNYNSLSVKSDLIEGIGETVRSRSEMQEYARPARLQRSSGRGREWTGSMGPFLDKVGHV